jgi:hypothetical protein
LHSTSEPQSDEALEAECLNGIETCQAKLRDLARELSELKMKPVQRMTPQSKAALESMGHDLTKSRHAIEDAHMEWQRRLGEIRKSRSRSTLQKNTGETERELRTLRAHMEAVNRREVHIDEPTRRRLRLAITKCEMEIASA